MTKHFKYLLAILASTASCFATLTSYAPGPDEADTLVPYRFDQVIIGGAGSYAGYTAPSATTTNLIVNFAPSGTAAAATTGASSVAVLPTTLKTLFLVGNATGLSTAHGAATYALPTPAATGTGCSVHFGLTTGPAATLPWFIGNLPTNWTVYIDQNSADPMLGVGILDQALTGTGSSGVVLGNGITVPGSFTVLSPIAKKSTLSAATYPTLTLGGDTVVFTAAVTGVTLANSTHPCTFKSTSSISGLGMGTGAISVGGASAGAAGLTSVLTISKIGASGTIPAITLVNAGNSVAISGS